MIALQIAAYADVDGGRPSTGGLSHSCLEIAEVQILNVDYTALVSLQTL